jgi:hypothetical protein
VSSCFITLLDLFFLLWIDSDNAVVISGRIQRWSVYLQGK